METGRNPVGDTGRSSPNGLRTASFVSKELGLARTRRRDVKPGEKESLKERFKSTRNVDRAVKISFLLGGIASAIVIAERAMLLL